MVSLGTKAKLLLENDILSSLPKGTYTLKITDISNAYWTHKIVK